MQATFFYMYDSPFSACVCVRERERGAWKIQSVCSLIGFSQGLLASQQCFSLTTNQHQPGLSAQKPTSEQAKCSDTHFTVYLLNIMSTGAVKLGPIWYIGIFRIPKSLPYTIWFKRIITHTQNPKKKLQRLFLSRIRILESHQTCPYYIDDWKDTVLPKDKHEWDELVYI